ncbi:MAG: chemotaxis protein CheB [Labilithrix sp.]|nr:chemotaxis protein CheB [Labilithrix sp.]MCW5813692.1 chemotaxis protein CheB [Labilithrix sp.]
MPIPQIVVMGTSAGGLRALERVLGALPARFALPIVVVQHRSKESEAFAEVMGSLVDLPVREAEDKEPVVAPGVYLAPPDYHLLLEPGRFALSTDEPVGFSRPSIDVLFESAADAYGSGVVGVLLTGANSDGTRGLRRIRAVGGLAIVQDPATAESPEMPAAAVKDGALDKVVGLDAIAEELLRLAPRPKGSAS